MIKIALPDRTNRGLFSSIEDYHGPMVASDIVTEALTVHLEAVLERENSRKRRSIRFRSRTIDSDHDEMMIPDWLAPLIGLAETQFDVDQMDFLLSN